MRFFSVTVVLCVDMQMDEEHFAEETYEDEDDENNENNWRNDYPDEDEFLDEGEGGIC